MLLTALIAILAPPTVPQEIGTPESWLELERSLGLDLPEDYKDYIQTYGTGIINNFIVPLNPFSADMGANLGKQIEACLGSLRVLRDNWGTDFFPYPLYPTSGGVLPWATTANGDTLYWLTEGSPESWLIIIDESRSGMNERHEGTMTDFLARLLRGQVDSEILPPPSFFKRRASFAP